MTQVDRLVAFLRSHPEATSLEVTLACRIVNVTGRVSDARAQGIDIVCERRSDGEFGYRVREKARVTAGTQEALALWKLPERETGCHCSERSLAAGHDWRCPHYLHAAC